MTHSLSYQNVAWWKTVMLLMSSLNSSRCSSTMQTRHFFPLSGDFRCSQIVSFLCHMGKFSFTDCCMIRDLIYNIILMLNSPRHYVVNYEVYLHSCLFKKVPHHPLFPLIAWLIFECDHGITKLQRDTAKSFLDVRGRALGQFLVMMDEWKT